MGRELVDGCVGPCPQGCTPYCAYHKPFYSYYCDECGEETDELYDWNGSELCLDCLKEGLIQIICDDMDSPHCEGCGYESDILYKPEDKWLCEDCLMDYLSWMRVEKGAEE